MWVAVAVVHFKGAVSVGAVAVAAVAQLNSYTGKELFENAIVVGCGSVQRCTWTPVQSKQRLGTTTAAVFRVGICTVIAAPRLQQS